MFYLSFCFYRDPHSTSLTERRKKRPGPPPGPPPELSDSEPEEEEYDPATGNLCPSLMFYIVFMSILLRSRSHLYFEGSHFHN
jgi:hypothetical protein